MTETYWIQPTAAFVHEGRIVNAKSKPVPMTRAEALNIVMRERGEPVDAPESDEALAKAAEDEAREKTEAEAARQTSAAKAEDARAAAAAAKLDAAAPRPPVETGREGRRCRADDAARGRAEGRAGPGRSPEARPRGAQGREARRPPPGEAEPRHGLMPDWEDLGEFLDTEVFAEPATIEARDGTSRPVTCLFDAAHTDAEIGGYEFNSGKPSVTLAEAATAGLERGAILILRGRRYPVLDSPEPDGTGLARVALAHPAGVAACSRSTSARASSAGSPSEFGATPEADPGRDAPRRPPDGRQPADDGRPRAPRPARPCAPRARCATACGSATAPRAAQAG